MGSDLLLALAGVGSAVAARVCGGRALLVVGVALTSLACGAQQPTPTQQADVAAYEAAMLACIDRAPTRYDADQCRAAVRAAWLSDAGKDGAK